MEKDLYTHLKEYHEKNTVRMHMPGHKQKGERDPLWGKITSLDLTEIEGMDDLHAPEGILKEAMERAARLWGAEESFFLVGSATAGILAGVAAVLQSSGKEILVARNCHKSVYHACELMQAKPRYLLPPWDENRGVFLSVTPESVEEALTRFPRVAMVVITSPTYEGVISDVAGIARVCRKKGAVLMVDEAHGAHLDLGGVFGGGAVKAGADLVVQSLHKTLPALTQTAVLHRCSERVDAFQLRRRLQMFQTSSPSYLLMASMDRCVRQMEREGKELLSRWRDNLAFLRQELLALSALEVLTPGEGMFAFDPTKITLKSKDPRCSGKELERALSRHGVVAEMSLWQNCLLYTGAMTDREDVLRTCAALFEIDSQMKAGELSLFSYCPCLPQTALEPSLALGLPWEEVEWRQARGRVSADYLWAYPPGIPVICPGEIFSPRELCALESLWEGGKKTVSSLGCPPGRLRVVKKSLEHHVFS